MSKKLEIFNDSIFIILGIIILSSFIAFYPIQLSYTVFLVGIMFFFFTFGFIGLVVDVKITEKKREKPTWWKLNLPVIVGILLMNAGTFYAAFNSTGDYPSDVYRITTISLGIALWAFAFGYDIWRKYRLYLRPKKDR